jgi:hypothetical protein
MKTIPIKNAMILWDNETKEVMVVNHPARNKEGNYLPMSDGACWFSWKHESTQNQLLMLYRIAIRLAVDFDIPLENIEAQFLKIPEYKNHITKKVSDLCGQEIY